MNRLYLLGDWLLQLLYPRRCACCDELTEGGAYLCGSCSEQLPFVSRDVCLICGQALPQCECQNAHHAISGFTAPFYHEKAAKNGIYLLKFSGRTDGAVFFADQMLKMIQREFSDIVFDGVCFVPLSKKRLWQRGYNQSKILAKRISRALGLPLLEDLLEKTRENQIQHGLPREKRFENVRGVYTAAGYAEGKTLLLVDDIKTTGATLEECSSQLLKSGAEKVYCVTATVVCLKDL